MNRLTVRDLMDRLKEADQDAEITLIIPWGYPTLLEQVDVTDNGVILSGRTEFDAPVVPHV